MRLAMLALFAVLCCGCSVTLTGAAKWSDAAPVNSEDTELRQNYEKMAADIKGFVDELKRAPNDVEAINTVLKKYGIERK